MIKDKLEKLLKKILRILSIGILRKYNPIVIGITGSAGKTSTKEAIYTILKNKFRCRRNRGNFNNEIGVPLTILGNYSETKGKIFWIFVLIKSILNILFGLKRFYPNVLILELAADKPGDIKYLVDIVKPQIGIITAIGKIPVHVEFYKNPEAVAREKGKLIESLSSDGFAVLNRDDEFVYNLREKTKAKKIFYGFSENSDIHLGNFSHRIDKNNIPEGISLKAEYKGSFIPMRLNNVLGKPQAYVIGATISVGLIMGMNLVEISQELLNYQAPKRRMKIEKGIKKTIILDDSYNASPISMKSALETLQSLPAKRKLAILADMLEIGEYSEQAHREIGRIVSKISNILITIGEKAKLISDSANRAGLEKENIFSFKDSEEAKKEIKDIVKKEDLILIKGSNSMRLDKIIEEIKEK
jgi:UDP-N-acetylmuramoyl-tripeptide--D-alanyl-D-alanine ligase